MAWDHINKKNVSFIQNNRFDPVTGCWNWTGYRNNHGYGKMHYLGRSEYVHRISAHCYFDYDFQSELQVLHRCDNPACFNPKHLFIGTRVDNMQDCVAKGRHGGPAPWTHCRKGHLLCGENAVVRFDTGRKYCRTCQNLRNKRRSQAVSNSGLL